MASQPPGSRSHRRDLAAAPQRGPAAFADAIGAALELAKLLELAEAPRPPELRIQALAAIVKRCVPQIREASVLDAMDAPQPTLAEALGAVNNGVSTSVPALRPQGN